MVYMTLEELAAIFDEKIVFGFHWINKRPASVRARIRTDDLAQAQAIRRHYPLSEKSFGVNERGGIKYYWLNYHGKMVYKILHEVGPFMTKQSVQVKLMLQFEETKIGPRRTRNKGLKGKMREEIIEKLAAENERLWIKKNDRDEEN